MSDVRKETKKKLRYIRSKSTPPPVQQSTSLTKDIYQNGNNMRESTRHHHRHHNHQEKRQIVDKIISNDSTNCDKKDALKDVPIIEDNIKNFNNIKFDNNTEEGMDMVQVSDNGSKTDSEVSINVCIERTGRPSILETEPSEYKTFSNS